MNSWQPILEEHLYSKAESILKLIAEKISNELDRQNNCNLIVGTSGQILFLNQYYGKNIDLGKHIERLFNDIRKNERIDCSLMNGLAGIGFALKIINDHTPLFQPVLFTNFYEYVRKLATKYIASGNFDFMHGYLGACLFLLEEDNNGKNYDVFNASIKNLKMIAKPQLKGLGWISDWEVKINYHNLSSQIDGVKLDCNIGLSHGSPGIILILAKLQSRYKQLHISSLLNAALECLLNEESIVFKKKSGYYYPVYSGDLGKSSKGQLAWCYSDLGISIMYYKLWELTGEFELFERASRIATSCAEKKLNETPTMNSGLCHGAAGVAHMFNKIYQITKEEKYKICANYWYSVLFDKFLVINKKTKIIQPIDLDKKTLERKILKDNGFLSGLAGIGLSINSVISPIKPNWDKLLLM